VTPACGHNICTSGGILAAGCDSCAASICAVDSFCCNIAWDGFCVFEVGSVCQENCNAPPPVINGLQGGSCQPQCNPGDSRCDGNEAYEACGADYRWSSTITQCPANGTDSCQGYTDRPTGGLKTICGQCQPGAHRCRDVTGTTNGTYIETCDTTGHWGTPQQCSMGQCAAGGGDFACVMQCSPNSTVCLGGVPGAPPDPSHPGTTNWGTCDAQGNLPVTGGTACTAGTSCRKHSNGQAVGAGALACVQCVGSDNESGLVDSACITSGAPNQIETCAANNTWNTPTNCANTAPYAGVCRPEGFFAAGEPAVCQ
jgi:hypothetical protein